jgi:hypothetical protein
VRYGLSFDRPDRRWSVATLDPRLLAVAGGALVAGLTLGVWLGAVAQRWRGKARIVGRFRAGRVAESEAAHRLRALGFEVLDSQIEELAHVYVDGVRVECPVRADYLVRRRGRLALVEVKSGVGERSPAENDTRRQLLEYWLVFGGLPLYHLDAASGAITRVGFAYGEARGPSWLEWVAAVALVAGTAAALVWWVTKVR